MATNPVQPPRPPIDPAVTSAALTWYRRNVCRQLGHDHGEPGELDCIINALAVLRTHRLSRSTAQEARRA